MPSNDKREALLEALQAVEHLGNSYLANNIRREMSGLEEDDKSNTITQIDTEE